MKDVSSPFDLNRLTCVTGAQDSDPIEMGWVDGTPLPLKVRRLEAYLPT